MIKCTLFSKSIAHVAREFRVGDAQAIVLADAKKLKAVMESNDVYYYNAARVEMHKGLFKKGMFEIPLVAPRGDGLHWIEGFHQVNAALEEGMTVVPIGTSLALAEQLKGMVGASHDDTAGSPFDFSACDATLM